MGDLSAANSGIIRTKVLLFQSTPTTAKAAICVFLQRGFPEKKKNGAEPVLFP
jgi:hypothetical protein